MWLCIEIQNPFLLSADIPFQQFLLFSMRVDVEYTFSFYPSDALYTRMAQYIYFPRNALYSGVFHFGAQHGTWRTHESV